MLTDIGVNLSSSRYRKDRRSVLQNALEAGVGKLILTGTSLSESKATLDICDFFANDFPEMLYATVGIHPHNAEQFNHGTSDALYNLSVHPSVVAIGETGLDFFRNIASPKAQQISFEAHLELATKTGLPMFLHEREAESLQLEILKEHRNYFKDAVVHCFTGNRATLLKYLELGLYIGITGWVCDQKRGAELRDIVAEIPIDRLMIETDAPYLLPQNMIFKPKNKRNEPSFLPWVAKEIAACRIECVEEIIEQTSRNAKKFFNI
ncbi:MAG: hydrolase TatD [Porticoccaceae bacterium]|nr:hydrolase TatD [Porticoccaceae bacterium]|tara:strand:+ start:793 stop:1587 length:795 start_codon:yes stop_codon:yes gene_type:complete